MRMRNDRATFDHGIDTSTMNQSLRYLAALPVLGLALAVPVGLAGAAGSTTAPYTDSNSVGYIGLCDQAGHQITTGNVHSTPFAWRAVSSVAAPSQYATASRTAILLAYQPQQGLAPGQWSGEGLSASSTYSNPATPMVAATSGDDSLEDFLEAFHPKWDGYVQLRIYLGAAGEEAYSLHYPSLSLHVVGDTWTAVGGGPVNCASGTAESLESVVLPSTTTTAAPTGGGSAGQKSSGTGTRSGSGAGGASKGAATSQAGTKGATDGSSSGRAAQASAALTSHRSSNSGLLIGLILGLLVVLAASVILLHRRRSLAQSGSSVTKGH
jgi:hypothetical protein